MFIVAGLSYVVAAAGFYIALARKAPTIEEPVLTLIEGSAPQAEVVELFPNAAEKAA